MKSLFRQFMNQFKKNQTSLKKSNQFKKNCTGLKKLNQRLKLSYNIYTKTFIRLSVGD